MADLYSKVTLRPRSKLEKLVEMFEHGSPVAPRPKDGLVSQLVLFYLLAAGCGPEAALRALGSLRACEGPIDAGRLAGLERSFVEPLCSAALVDETLAALQAVGRAASDGIETIARRDPDEARRRLGALAKLSAQQADYLLLAGGACSTVAPGPAALRVASRLGYPGTTYAALARSLDGELPEGDPHEVAWRAHHALRLHGERVCHAKSPSCGACRAASACSYRGQGDDPASRIASSGG